MLKKYQELQATLESASQQARALYEAGAPTERLVRGLDAPIREVRERVRLIEANEARSKEKAEAKARAKSQAANANTNTSASPSSPATPAPPANATSKN